MRRLGAWLRERQAHRAKLAAAVGDREAERAPALGLIGEHKLVYRRGEHAANTIENSREDAPAMAFEHITTELSERVLTITLNRPERLNAWTPTMAEELIEAFDRADADDEVRVVIVTGAGRGFCAGADLAAGGETFDHRARGSAAGLGAARQRRQVHAARVRLHQARDRRDQRTGGRAWARR